ncbi:hypothetical protein A6P39_024000 [Streptomyces sp. FXJ1.172]|uniref:hypothetical protein n=1 Tax=Streptomyces sp. FXJ1.172 TaxID=710705 RepID=UPI0007CF4B04|nr:hypothetical protein [Streptomyces sp. FXJ1.172]WEO96842.1 hypothetical protein A6P39_024000 [Streptomyces sp. FXJ1.172]
MGASSDGYTVTSGMSGQAHELDGAGDDAGHIHQAVQPTECYTQDALGGAESSDAFNAFSAAWLDDAATLESALHELAGKVRLAKGAYAGGDHTAAARSAAVSSAAAGIGRGVTTMPTQRSGPYLTTMPTPVGNEYVTTMPVYADRPSALTKY